QARSYRYPQFLGVPSTWLASAQRRVSSSTVVQLRPKLVIVAGEREQVERHLRAVPASAGRARRRTRVLQLSRGPQGGRHSVELFVGRGVKQTTEAAAQDGFDRQNSGPPQVTKADAEQSARITLEDSQTEYHRVV
ncbi:hypothetical protein OY671_010629, partial [Metschnikowia pulcherrima]